MQPKQNFVALIEESCLEEPGTWKLLLAHRPGATWEASRREEGCQEIPKPGSQRRLKAASAANGAVRNCKESEYLHI